MGLIILNPGGDRVNTSRASGRLMMSVFSAVAVFKRELLLKRQKADIAKSEKARRLGIGGASVCQMLREGPVSRKETGWGIPRETAHR
ncbi:hypothetical protein V5F53_19540 [Xanthobacter sp. V4C-4]|uniref:hypothetical protein n=1 Tax=Xanthobacter cornucopiae TaxID=3119924 RepID=UPI00372B3BA4